MLGQLAEVVREDARSARERLEGYRVLARIVALCSELTIDVDPGAPRFFPMTTVMRQVGGPNPEGEYDLATLVPGRAYRVTGRRGTAAYLGFQVMAGTGLAPRRQAAYLSDRELALDEHGAFGVVLATDEPELGPDEVWLPVPEDASAVVVRQYVGDRCSEQPATYSIALVDDPEPPVAPSDDAVAEQLTAMTWTAWKLMTLHRTILPELLDEPNRLVTAEAAALGSENTTPDNLYMIGVFDLEPGQGLELDLVPPETRYWSVTLENVWHECLEPRRRRSSGTHVDLPPGDDGRVRLLIAPEEPMHTAGPGVTHWLDTGGRDRGFVILRWLDNPEPPEVTVRLVEGVR